MKPAPSGFGAAQLIVRLRLRRLFNRAGHALQRFARGGRATDGGLAKLGGLLLSAGLVWAALQTSRRTIAATARAFGVTSSSVEPLPSSLIQVFSAQVFLLMLVALLSALGSKDLAEPEWDLEWLATLPVRVKDLLWIRLLERTLTNPLAWTALFPFVTVLGMRGVSKTIAALSGVLLAVPLFAVVAAVQTLFDSGIKVRLRPSSLRSIQGWSAVLSAICLLLAVSFGFRRGQLALELAQYVPVWLNWTPAHGVVRVLTDRPLNVRALLTFLVQCALVVVAVRALVAYLLRNGVVAGGTRESGRRASNRSEIHAAARAPKKSWLSPLIRRELRLLSRNRSLLVQTALLPLALVGSRWVASRANGLLSNDELSTGAALAMGFGVAAYTLLLALPQSFRHEMRSLWLLYTLPQPLSAIFARKGALWAAVACVYPLVAALFVGLRFGLDTRLVLSTALALFAVLICATSATALSVLAARPEESEPRAALAPSHVIVYLLIAISAGAALFSIGAWTRIVLFLISASTALAFWQRARARLPYLLDSTAASAPDLFLADGLLAAAAFFVLQLLLPGFIPGYRDYSLAQQVALKVALSGAVTLGSVHLIFKLRRVRVPAMLGPRLGRAVGVGLLAGAALSVLGAGYVIARRELPSLREWTGAAPTLQGGPWLLAIGVLLFPWIEEPIFRGLVFGGLRKSLSFVPAALLSSAIFAAFHASGSAPAALVCGLGLAWAYEYSGLLLAPIVAHLLYNLALTLLATH